MHIGLTGSGEPPEDAEMNEILSPRQKLRNLEPWRTEAEHANSRSRRLHTILNLYVSGLNIAELEQNIHEIV